MLIQLGESSTLVEAFSLIVKTDGSFAALIKCSQQYTECINKSDIKMRHNLQLFARVSKM